MLHLSYSSEPVMRLDHQILLKLHPLTLLAGSVLACHSTDDEKLTCLNVCSTRKGS